MTDDPNAHVLVLKPGDELSYEWVSRVRRFAGDALPGLGDRLRRVYGDQVVVAPQIECDMDGVWYIKIEGLPHWSVILRPWQIEVDGA